MDARHLIEIVRALRDEGSDTPAVEVKGAVGGLPDGLERTVSAMANRPGGGTIILGLDERSGFAPVPVYDVATAQKALAGIARQAVEPPVAIQTAVHDVEGTRVVVIEVDELPSSLKPCRVRASGKAYLRAHDGTYEMSELEAAAFVANRDKPRFDQAVVEGATVAGDLDPELVTSYQELCRASSTSLARFTGDELLLRTGVVTSEGLPTLAGLLALGVYPQQFFPNFVIRSRVAPMPGDPPGTRASDVRTFDGPLPLMLDEATRWVQRNTRTRVRFAADGHGYDEPEYPPEVVRELIANALIHRDIGPHAASYPVSLVVEHHRLVISNPGGLWGITVDRLGRSGISSARNDVLLRIAQNVRTSGGRRVVEGLATGLSTVLATLRAAGMVAPEFIDQGVRFTVRVPHHTLLAPDDLSWLSTRTAGLDLSDTQRHALVAMRHGRQWTNRTFRDEFPRDSTQARADLQGLVDAGLAMAVGERGGRVYTIAPPRSPQDPTPAAPRASDGDTSRQMLGPTTLSRASVHDPAVVTALSAGPLSVRGIATATGLSGRQVVYALRGLMERGEVVMRGGRGDRTSVYERSGQAE